MKLLGINFPSLKKAQNLASVGNWRSWFKILEPYPGAWQQNVEINRDAVLAYPANFACMTLIAGDCAKLRLKLVEKDKHGIWGEVEIPAFSPVLRKPNHYQTRIQFWENYFLSKLSCGNVYVLKERDDRGVVIAWHILDWQRVTPLVADDGSVFYKLNRDYLAGTPDDITVPAREIIHDRYNCIYHPLIGTSPIFAAGVAATQGINIQNQSANFFGNKSQPGGILTAPGHIDEASASRLKQFWDENFTGKNAGKVAVVGDDLKYVSLATNARDSQLIEQLQWTASVICSVYHVPPYKIGQGSLPAGLNIQALNVEYYSQALQHLLEAAELCIDEGLGLNEVKGKTIGTEFDTKNLLRMDSVTQMEVLDKAKNIMSPDEQRKELDLAPTPGGNVVYRQQQDFSLAALAKRDAKADPFAKEATTPTTADNDNELEAQAAKAMAVIYKELR